MFRILSVIVISLLLSVILVQHLFRAEDLEAHVTLVIVALSLLHLALFVVVPSSWEKSEVSCDAKHV